MLKQILTSLVLIIAAVTTPVKASSEYADVARAQLLFAGIDDAQPDIAHLGLAIDLAPGWHTYWRTPGEGGVPPRFNWSLSENIDEAQTTVSWPWPIEFVDFGYKSYGYEGRVVLPITVKLVEGQSIVRLALDYAVCADVCVPLTATLSAVIDEEATAILSVDHWRALTPDYAASLQVDVHYDGDGMVVDMPGAQGRELLIDNDEGMVFYAAALNEKGQARFAVPPSDYKYVLAGKPLRIAVKAAGQTRSLVTIKDAPELKQVPK